MTVHGWDFLVRKDDLRAHEVRQVALDPQLADRELALRVEAFALTTNTMTYAVTGDSLGYWRFYPADDGWGRIPAWGYAQVVASAHPEIAVGERLFGYVPMSSHARMLATKVQPGALPGSLIDASPHRRSLPPAYNFYRRLGTALVPLTDDEALRAVLDPLFFTSFLIDDLIAERGWDCGDAIVITSASSKTAIGTAFLLHARRPTARIVGLTSPRNRGFVEQLGLYDEVVEYAQLAEPGEPSAREPAARVAARFPGDRISVIDFAGDAAPIARLSAALGPRLGHVLHVGATHAGAGGSLTLPAATSPREANPREANPREAGPREGFFAPSRIADRAKHWGPAELEARHDAAWTRFLPFARSTIRLERITGPDALGALYDELATRGLSPDRGCFIQP